MTEKRFTSKANGFSYSLLEDLGLSHDEVIILTVIETRFQTLAWYGEEEIRDIVKQTIRYSSPYKLSEYLFTNLYRRIAERLIDEHSELSHSDFDWEPKPFTFRIRFDEGELELCNDKGKWVYVNDIDEAEEIIEQKLKLKKKGEQEDGKKSK